MPLGKPDKCLLCKAPISDTEFVDNFGWCDPCTVEHYNNYEWTREGPLGAD